MFILEEKNSFFWDFYNLSVKYIIMTYCRYKSNKKQTL